MQPSTRHHRNAIIMADFQSQNQSSCNHLVCCGPCPAGVPLGIIPRGTANAFSVALGIPTHIDDPINFASQAADVILQVGACLAGNTSR